MAATSVAEQQLAEIPLLKDARPSSLSGRSPIGAILGWLQKGVKAAFCVLGSDNGMAFLGEDGKLFELERPWRARAEASAAVELPTPKEIFHGSEAWKLPDEPDLSAVCVTSTFAGNVFVVDSQMRLFSRFGGQGLSRCLPSRHVAQVACGVGHVLVLTTDGEVHASGGNSRGQLGLGHRNDVETPEMKAVSIKCFATSVACGALNSVVINCEGQAAFFGEWSDVWQSDAPVELESLVGPLVKAACGYEHTLLLTAAGHLVGFGKAENNQLGQLGETATLKEIPFESAKGRAVDIFCHPLLDASVVLTDGDELYVCGEVGALFDLEQPIPTFVHCHKPAVILGGRMVCMRSPTRQVMIPGFNNPEFCEIEVVPAGVAGEFELPGGGPAVLELAKKLPRDSLCRLVERSVSDGVAVFPSDVHHEYMDGAMPESQETGPSVTQPSPGESVFISLHAIRARSPYLWALLQSELTGDISQTADRKKQLRLSKYSARVLQAYGRYLHEDVVVTDAVDAIELLELAREYGDETGLCGQCACVARRLVREKDLPSCLRRCIQLRHMALAVDLVKLQLSVGNCCDVLQAAEMGSLDDPYAEYIRSIAMEFALAHIKEVVNSAPYNHLDSSVKARMLSKLYAS